MDDIKTAFSLGGMSRTVTNLKNDLLGLANVIENTLLPKIQKMATLLNGSANAFGGLVDRNGRPLSSQASQKVSQGANDVPSTGGGAAGGNGGNDNVIADNGRSRSAMYASASIPLAKIASNAMPSVPTAVEQDFLTQRSAFYGIGGGNPAAVNSLQKQLAKQGFALNNMDTTRALLMAQSTGLTGVGNLNQVMQGAATASQITPGIGITEATSAIGGTMNSANTVNLARTIGINIRQSDGTMLPFPQMVDKIWAFISRNSNGQGMDKQSLQYSMQPGYGIYNMLNGLFNGDPVMIKMVSDALLAKASFGGKPLGNITTSEMVKAGIQSATVRNIASQNAAATGTLVSTAAATAGGYAGAADIGTGMNNLAAAMSDLTAVLGGGKGFLSGVTGLGNGAMGSALKLGGGFGLSSLLKGGTSSIFGKEMPAIVEKILPFLLAGFLAEGGPADKSMPYVVGEKGPELFIPKTDGTVLPNSMFKADGGGASSYGASGPKTALSDDQLKNVLKAAGFKGSSLDTAFKVARMESGGRTGALNNTSSTGDYSQGLFQINMIGNLGQQRNAQYLKDYASIGYKGPQSLYDPAINAKIAYDISHGGTVWSNAWTNTARKLGISDAGGVSVGGSSAMSMSVRDATAAARFEAAQAAAFSGATGGATGASYNYNLGGVTIQITAAKDPNKTGAAVADAIKNLGKS
jgi:hypothetical protein